MAIESMTMPTISSKWDDYVWIVVTGALAAAFMAWGIGANDVANSFATSVGSKTLKLWQAVIIAGIFEFAGAMALGGETAKTVASKIADVDIFEEVPELYMYGMLCSLAVAGTWLLLATMWCFPVSTTHTITGSIMGFALVYGGWSGVVWHKEQGDFPFTTGFLPIVLSWFFSPLIGGILGATFFNLNRIFILRSENSTMRAIYAIPLLVLFTFYICLLFVLVKGAKADLQKKWPCVKTTGFKGLPSKDCSEHFKNSAWIAAAAAGGVAILTALIVIPILKRKVRKDAEEEAARAEEGYDKDADLEDEAAPQPWEKMHVHEIPKDAPFYAMPYHVTYYLGTATARQVVKGLTYDVHTSESRTAQMAAREAAAEQFLPETEKIFSYLQVFSASCVAFAHGSNDVANSIGPFSAIFTVYETYDVPGSKSTTPKWIFALGGGMIVVGLATYGYNIITTIGVKYLHLTPSRGFCAELAAGLTIALASFFGIPVSTTQIIVGAETGVGLSESVRGIDWFLLARTFTGWVFTILIAMGLCAGLFAAGAYAPSIIMAKDMRAINFQVYDLTTEIYAGTYGINTTINDLSLTFAKPADKPYSAADLQSTITTYHDDFTSAIGSDSDGDRGFVNPELVRFYLNQAVWLNATYSDDLLDTL